MQLKARQRGGAFRRPGGASSRLVGYALMVFLALGLVALGAWLRGAGWFGEVRASVETELRSLPLRLQSLFVDPPRVTIDIKHKHVQKLVDKRDEALERQFLLTSPEDFVPGTVRFTGADDGLHGPLDAQVRLKGDIVDHLEGAKWSFRVHLPGDATLLGMKRFSLHHPKTRNYLAEWALHRAMAREDVLALRYQFVSLTLNGRDLGIYAIEEHFEKRLIEHNRRREGPIVRFNEAMFWRQMATQKQVFEGAQVSHSGDYSSSEVDGFQTSTVLADPVLRAQFVRAADRLSRFRLGELPTSEVFDVDRLARYYALTDLFGAEHGARWHNERFYYNPVTTVLEPIFFDGDAGGPCVGLCGTLEGTFVGVENEPPLESYWATLFSDPVFFRAYMRELTRVSQRSYLEEFLGEVSEELGRATAILHKEFVDCELDEEALYLNQDYIRGVLDPVRTMHGYAKQLEPGRVQLELAVIQILPIEVHAVTYRGEVLAEFREPVVLPARLTGVPVQYRRIDVDMPDGVEVTPETLSRLKVEHSIYGLDQRYEESMLPWPREAKWQSSEGAPGPSDLSRFPFLEIDQAEKEILIRRGAWQLTEDLVFPAGFTVTCTEGTSIDLVNSSALVSRSPLVFTGSGAAPVLVHSSDETGQGVIVLGVEERSTLSGVVFRGLGSPSRAGWNIPGAVTFYESPVTIDSCRFEDSRSEDALNILRAPFHVEHSTFARIGADAIDGDFCPDSMVVDSEFSDVTNDAIDVSGSRIVVRRVEVRRAGDKGLSAGENSEVEVDGLLVEDSEIAVASKDLSRVVLRYPTIRRCKVGFTAFQKKPEFGPSRIVAHGITSTDVEREFLIERGSDMNHGSKQIPAEYVNVEAMLYGEEYGRASR